MRLWVTLWTGHPADPVAVDMARLRRVGDRLDDGLGELVRDDEGQMGLRQESRLEHAAAVLVRDPLLAAVPDRLDDGHADCPSAPRRLPSPSPRGRARRLPRPSSRRSLLPRFSARDFPRRAFAALRAPGRRAGSAARSDERAPEHRRAPPSPPESVSPPLSSRRTNKKAPPLLRRDEASAPAAGRRRPCLALTIENGAGGAQGRRRRALAAETARVRFGHVRNGRLPGPPTSSPQLEPNAATAHGCVTTPGQKCHDRSTAGADGFGV